MSDAIQLAHARGWPLVKLSSPSWGHPAAGKFPLGQGWPTSPGLTDEEARAALDAGHNLGIITGERADRLIVVDIDGETPDGLTPTFTVHTGGGGVHLYYRLPDGVEFKTPNKVGAIAEGVDIRYTGGLVVFPPSVHKETGAQYEFQDADAPVQPLPTWVITRLHELEAEREQAPQAPAQPVAVPTPAAATRYAAAALQGACDDIRNAPQGTRNHTLNTKAYHLGGIVDMPEQEARAALLAAALDVGLTQQESQASIRSGWEAGRQNPHAARATPVPTPAPAAPGPRGCGVGTDTPPPFRVLGHTGGRFYFLPEQGGQVRGFSANQLAHMPHLMELAPRTYWHAQAPQGDNPEKIDKDKACEMLIDACYRVGVYNPDNLRGRGAWHDAGRIVLHRGKHLLIDGERHELHTVDSEYIYQREGDMSIPYDSPMTAEQGAEIVRLCRMLSWDRPIYADLLAGWMALAPICGVLDWRPHIWITGAAGCGKSFIQDHIMSVLLQTVIRVQGCSTEAGVRQLLHRDALAIAFDEAESDTGKAAQNIGRVLELARQASSLDGGVIAKGSADGNAQTYRIRSMFCLSSIGLALQRRADISRVTVLSMTANAEGAESLARFREIQELTAEICETRDWATSFIARSCRQAPMIREACTLFAEYLAATKTSRRNADQLGALLGGWWSLTHDVAPTEDDIRESLRDFELDDLQPDAADTNDEEQLLRYLIQRKVRCDLPGRVTRGDPRNWAAMDLDMRMTDATIGELIDNAANGEGAIKEYSDAVLQRHGMRAIKSGLFISNKHAELQTLLNGTQWAADWGQYVRRLTKTKPDTQRLVGFVTKGNTVNYELIFQPFA